MRKKFFLLGFLGFLGVLLLFLTLFLRERKLVKVSPPATTDEPRRVQGLKPVEQTPIAEPSLPPEEKPQILPLPQVYFETYENQAALPTLPANLKIYTFKTNFPLVGILTLGQRMGLNNYKYDDNYVVLYNTDNPQNLGFLLFDRNTGGFRFDSFGQRQLSISNSQLLTSSRTFLQDLGMIDETVECRTTFTKEDAPGITFVECHRNWAKVGLPILNFFGILNLPEDKSLANLNLGEENVGEERPDDFNTITVGVYFDGRIASIDSNLRQIISATTVSGQNLLTPQEALAQFSKHQAQLSLILPAGEGFVDLGKVHPNNLVSAKNAVITDYVLTFGELPFPLLMEKLLPMYLVRGTAELASGYRVRFSETLPALRSGLSALPKKGLGAVAGESIKLGTFTPAPTPSPTIIQPSPTSTIQPPLCKPGVQNLNPLYDLGSLGKLGLYQKDDAYYYLPHQSEILPDLQELLSEIEKLNPPDWQTRPKIVKQWGKYTGVCPLRMTGSSPTIFVYAKEAKTLKIKVERNLTYTDPAMVEDIWKVRIDERRNLLVNGVSRHYIYYEYEPLVWEKPKEGWVIGKEKIESFVRETLSPAFGLTPLEEERLVFEFRHASFGMSSDDVFVGMIPQKEVEEKIPLKVIPEPNLIIRLHFYLAPTLPEDDPLRGSTSFKIPREDFLLLELGAVREEKTI